MNPRRRARAVIALLFGFAAGARGADQIQYGVAYIDDNSDVTVATTAFSLAKTVWQRTRLLLDVELDQTTIPPLASGSGPVTDAITGASRPARQSKSEFQKNRGQIIAGVQQGLGENTEVSASYYNSQETDYASQALVGGFSQSLADKNFTLDVTVQYTLDSVGEILADGKLLNRGKETHQASLAITQLLTPTSFIRMGADGMRNLGFLSDPYRLVHRTDPADPLRQVQIPENVPSIRFRQAAWIEYNQYLTTLAGSYSAEYRYAFDDWNVKSHMVWLKLNKYITPNWVLSPQYRFYEQTAADFGDYAASEPGKYFAPGDRKLQAFGAHFMGAGLTCYLRAFARKHPNWDFLIGSSVTVKLARYFTDLTPGNDAVLVREAQLRFEF
jgi:hypothetical protein